MVCPSVHHFRRCWSAWKIATSPQRRPALKPWSRLKPQIRSTCSPPYDHWIAFRENLQETPFNLMGKTLVFWLRFCLNQFNWYEDKPSIRVLGRQVRLFGNRSAGTTVKSEKFGDIVVEKLLEAGSLIAVGLLTTLRRKGRHGNSVSDWNGSAQMPRPNRLSFSAGPVALDPPRFSLEAVQECDICLMAVSGRANVDEAESKPLTWYDLIILDHSRYPKPIFLWVFLGPFLLLDPSRSRAAGDFSLEWAPKLLDSNGGPRGCGDRSSQRSKWTNSMNVYMNAYVY